MRLSNHLLFLRNKSMGPEAPLFWYAGQMWREESSDIKLESTKGSSVALRANWNPTLQFLEGGGDKPLMGVGPPPHIWKPCMGMHWLKPSIQQCHYCHYYWGKEKSTQIFLWTVVLLLTNKFPYTCQSHYILKNKYFLSARTRGGQGWILSKL